MDKKNLGATVVIPTLNRQGFLGDTIRDLLAQVYRPLEILVVDQSEEISDTVKSLALQYPDLLSHYAVKFRGLPTARNFGWQNSRFPIVIFIDDDVRLPENFVEMHVTSHASQKVGIVAGGVDEPHRPDEKDLSQVGRFNFWTATPHRGFSSLQGQEVDSAFGANFSTSQKVLEEVGGFDEALNVGAALYEETEFCLRAKAAGYKVIFNPQARLTHLVAPDGGTRTPELGRYLWALSHNRSFLIRRYLKWYQCPVAVLRLALLGFSYARLHRNPRALSSAFQGFFQGFKQAGHSPRISRWI